MKKIRVFIIALIATIVIVGLVFVLSKYKSYLELREAYIAREVVTISIEDKPSVI